MVYNNKTNRVQGQKFSLLKDHHLQLYLYLILRGLFCPKFCAFFTELLMTVLKVSATVLKPWLLSRLQRWRWTSGNSNRNGFQKAKHCSAHRPVLSPVLGRRLARVTSGVPCGPGLHETLGKERSQLLNPRLLASSKDARHNTGFVE